MHAPPSLCVLGDRSCFPACSSLLPQTHVVCHGGAGLCDRGYAASYAYTGYTVY